MKILVADQYVRAVEGGVGAAKTAGNYAASLLAAEEAHHAGFTQVLWLDGVHRRHIDEVGTMNIMLRLGDEVVTPPLSGTILPGVTRDSALVSAEGPLSIERDVPSRTNKSAFKLVIKLVRPDGSLAMERTLASQ